MSTRHKSARRRPHETRAREDDDQMLARWCNTGPLNVRGIVACERCLRAIVMRVSVRAIVMRVSSVPSAHSPHASMRPACTIDNAGPVRWMSEVSLPTSVAYNAGTLVQHRSVECQRYRCLRALPTSHCDESLVRAIDNAGTLVQHRSVECQRYRCLRALPTSHCDESPTVRRGTQKVTPC